MRTTLRFHFTPVSMAKINNARDSSSWGYSKGHIHQWWEWNLHRYYESLCDSFAGKWEKIYPKLRFATLGHIAKGYFILPKRYFLNCAHCCSVHKSQKTRNNLDSPKENMDKDCLVCFLPLAQVSSSSSVECSHWPPVLPGWWFNCLPC